MGSKRAMLRNGLGTLIRTQLEKRTYQRFFDLFAGSAAVSWYVAENHSLKVVASDLQLYSSELANAILLRTDAVAHAKIWEDWHGRAMEIYSEIAPMDNNGCSAVSVMEARSWAEFFPEGTLVRAYAGHYFSPLQSAWIEALRATLPQRNPARSLCLGALIVAASKAAAAPGHTAQPFQPTSTARRFIEESWKKSIVELVQGSLKQLSARYALSIGNSNQIDANKLASELSEGDIAFVDPPYSGVHYSRFYHVLESIARGEAREVSGIGRYPPPSDRPKSAYSTKTTSQFAVMDLLAKLAARGADVIFTFPDHECSNGLSGRDIQDFCAELFTVESRAVHSTFSTLGGGRAGEGSRRARQDASELLLVLRARH